MTGAGSVIDQLWIALGIKTDTSGLTGLRREVEGAKSSLLSMGTAVKAFVAGFAIKEIANIGSTFEQNQIQIAGFLSALGQSSDFNQGLQDAQGVIQQITKDAAILPGEAQEYIDVFKAGLPFVQGAMPGGSLDQITAFTNRLTAIGKSFNLNADVIAREFDHMLSPGKGMASLRLPLFRQLLSFMPKMANGARVTAESFNAMSAPQRLALLQATFEKLQPMLDASATSFDAMWGAAVSAVKQMTRFATVPLFKGLKQALDSINSALYDNKGNQTAFGKSITDGISSALKYITQLLTAGGRLMMWLSHSKAAAAALKVGVTLLGTALAGLAVQKTIGAFVGLIKVMTNLRSLLMGGVFLAIALVAEDLYVFYRGGDSVTGLLVNRLGPALLQVKLALAAIAAGLVAAGLLGSPIIAVAAAVVALGLTIYTVATRWDEFVGGMKAIWQEFVEYVENTVNTVTNAFGLGDAFGTSKTRNEALDRRINQNRAILRDRRAMAGSSPLAGSATGAATSQPWSPGAFGGAPAWSPAENAPMVSSGGDTSITNQTTNHVVYNIRSTDPKAAAREVAKTQIRNAQSAVKY